MAERDVPWTRPKQSITQEFVPWIKQNISKVVWQRKEHDQTGEAALFDDSNERESVLSEWYCAPVTLIVRPKKGIMKYAIAISTRLKGVEHHSGRRKTTCGVTRYILITRKRKDVR